MSLCADDELSSIPMVGQKISVKVLALSSMRFDGLADVTVACLDRVNDDSPNFC